MSEPNDAINAPDISLSKGKDREDLLDRITQKIRASLDLSEILEETVQEIRAFLDVDRVKIYSFFPDDSGKVIAEATNEILPSLLGLHFPASDIPLPSRQLFINARQRVIVDVESGQKILEPLGEIETSTFPQDLRHIPVDPCHRRYLQGMGVASSLVIPIMIQINLWGLLVAHHSQARYYSERELQVTQLLVDQISIAIAQAQLLQRARQQAEHEAAINRLHSILHAKQDEVFQKQEALNLAVWITGSDGGRLYITGEHPDHSPQLYQWGSEIESFLLEETPFWQQIFTSKHPDFKQKVEEVKVRFEELPTLDEAPNLQIYHIPDLYTYPEFQELKPTFEAKRIRSLLMIPLQYHQRCIGCLTLFRHEVDQSIFWAGRINFDDRNQLPRQSFEAWQEISHTLPAQWTAEEIKLAQTMSIHLYLAVMERRIKEMLRHQAYHDNLTGLPNRLLFNEHLSVALADVHLSRGEFIAVLFLDLDGFKTINDTLGHHLGDRLLQDVGKRLQNCVRTWDLLARWGGDEFTILLNHLSEPQKATALALKILAALQVPFFCADKELYLKGSIGIAIAPYHGEDADTLLKNADAAMFLAKQKGRNTYQVYTADLGQKVQNRLLLEHALYKALDRQEFELYYQPLFSLHTNRIVGLETLLRWRSPERGFVSPSHFIPLAEETGLINPIGQWVLETACHQLHCWQQSNLANLSLAVNLSVRQFQEVNFFTKLTQILEKTGLNCQFLELEITETLAMQDIKQTMIILKQLRKLGIKISMDDFGTGYSSLAFLKQFPLDKLKIDQSFIKDLSQDSQDAAIVRAIVSLGHGLGLTVVAEGVETREQLDFLRAIGCDIVQGYLISRPLAIREITELLSNPQAVRI